MNLLIDIPVKSIRILSILAQHTLDIGKELGFTEEECEHPNFSKWINEEIRNYDQSLILKIQLNVRHRIEQDKVKQSPTSHLTDLLTGNTK